MHNFRPKGGVRPLTPVYRPKRVPQPEQLGRAASFPTAAHPLPPIQEVAQGPYEPANVIEVNAETSLSDRPLRIDASDLSEKLSELYLTSPSDDLGSDLPSPVFGRPKGGRHPSRRGSPHFYYGRVDYNHDQDEEIPDSPDSEAVRSCIRAVSNLIGRRVSRAMIDLVGIEPNPGPAKKTNAKSKSATATTKKRSIPMPKVPKASGKSLTTLSGHTWNPRADQAAYMLTLSDAERYPPVRLGGETMVPTGLTTLHTLINVNDFGGQNASIVIHPRVWSPMLIAPGSTGSYGYVARGGFQGAQVQTLQSVAAAARVVSVKVKVLCTSSATNDNGTITIGLCPTDPGFIGRTNQVGYPDSNSSSGNFLSSNGFPICSNFNSNNAPVAALQGVDQFVTEDWSETFPFKTGASCFWLPEDPSSMIFMADRMFQANERALATTNTTSLTTASSGPTNASPIVDPFFCIGVQGTGSGASFAVEIFLNLEYTSTSGASNIVATQAGSMSSVQAFEVVRKVGSNMTNYSLPDPDASFLHKAGDVGKAMARGGLSQASKFLFGSSDVGDMIGTLL